MAYLITILVFDIRYLISESQKKNIYYSTPLEAILENIRVPQIDIAIFIVTSFQNLVIVTDIMHMTSHELMLLLIQVTDVDGKTVRQVIETTIDELTKRLNRPQLPLVSYYY